MQIENIEETEKLLNEMMFFFENINKTNAELKSELQRKELEQDDLLHEIELSKMNGIELMAFAKRLKRTRIERRDIKDKMQFVSTTKGFTDKVNNRLIVNDIKQVIANINTLKKFRDTRYYNAKALTDLKICKVKKELKESSDVSETGALDNGNVQTTSTKPKTK